MCSSWKVFLVKLDASKLIAALKRKEANFIPQMEIAVRHTAMVLMSKLLEKTPSRQNQPVQVYQRTDRLVDGWGPAANAVGIAGNPGGEGTFLFVSTESYISFTAMNEVPYAWYVEVAPGPWSIPPNAKGGPQWKGGYHFTALSLLEMDTQPRILDNEVIAAWNRL